MAILSSVLVITMVSFIGGSAEGAKSTSHVVLDQFHSILRDQTETVDLILGLSIPAYHPIPATNFVQLIRVVNMALFNYMQGIYEIVKYTDLKPKPIFPQNATIEVALMCNYSATLMNYFENIANSSDGDWRQADFGEQLRLMPVGPPRAFILTPNPELSKYADADRPKTINENLEELLTNVEIIVMSKGKIFEIIQQYLLSLPTKELPHVGIMLKNVENLHLAFFELLSVLRIIARNVPNLVVEDVIAKESRKMSALARSILSAMIPMDKDYLKIPQYYSTMRSMQTKNS